MTVFGCSIDEQASKARRDRPECVEVWVGNGDDGVSRGRAVSRLPNTIVAGYLGVDMKSVSALLNSLGDSI